jgi:5-methyltetrahydrofolate--homocysteine methyltransferase
MSAEAAGAAFECIKSAMPVTDKTVKCRIILATVKGDVHDIGKNIVKLILENYGFEVVDLGKDVSPEKIVDEAVRLNARIVGLSALMTTTLPSMADTVSLLKQNAPWCKVMVGGAVLTEEYAKEIGADFYGKDATAAVKFAEKVNEN